MDRLLRLPEVAEMTGVSQNTLRYWRHRGTGPRSARLGRRVVYREGDVHDWLEAAFAQAEGPARDSSGPLVPRTR